MSADEWTIEVTFLLIDQLEDKQLDMLSDKLSDLDWTVAQLPDGYLSVFGASGDNESLEAASLLVVDISKQTLSELSIDGQLERIAICSERWREKEALEPSIPELLAARDIGKVLGVSRQRVSQLHHHHPQFPAPVVYTGAGPLWTRSAIDWFASVWDRRPGRRTDSPKEAEDSLVVTEFRPREAETGCRANRQRVEA